MIARSRARFGLSKRDGFGFTSAKTRSIVDQLRASFLRSDWHPSERPCNRAARFADRARITRQPAASLGQRDEAFDRLVEQRGLLEIEHVAGFRKHQKARGR